MLGAIRNREKWSESDNVRLSDIIMKNIGFENILSFRVTSHSCWLNCIILYDAEINQTTGNLEIHLLMCLGHYLEGLSQISKEKNNLDVCLQFIKKIIQIKFIKFVKVRVWMCVNIYDNNFSLSRVESFNKRWLKFTQFVNWLDIFWENMKDGFL